MPAKPKLTAAEWREIQRFLPPSSSIGRPRQDDKQAVAELLFAEAVWPFGQTLQRLFGRTRAGFLSVRRQRWQQAGVWDDILSAGHPAVQRMRLRECRGSADMMQMFAIMERA